MRHDLVFPIQGEIGCIAVGFLKMAWEEGWLDEYSEEHFLIKAINNRLEDFVGKQQFIENNINYEGIVTSDKEIDTRRFNINFCINFSQKLQYLSNVFGNDHIKEFVTGQLAAGKEHYDEDTFFEAMSEVSILSFFAPRGRWTSAIYEPPVKKGSNNKNPEATLIGPCSYKLFGKNIDGEIKINIEVKSPRFPHDMYENEKTIIPGVLLTDQGKGDLKDFCLKNSIKYLDPRVSKLKDFINSAASKFLVPSENEVNLLYINWSYRDFPTNGFLEAWSLLINKFNGILVYPEIAKLIGVEEDAFKKITAVIVYTESLEGLMFSDFRYVWQRNGKGTRFRMWILDDKLRESEREDSSDILLHATGMNPSEPDYYYCLSDPKINTDEDRINARIIAEKVKNIILENSL